METRKLSFQEMETTEGGSRFWHDFGCGMGGGMNGAIVGALIGGPAGFVVGLTVGTLLSMGCSANYVNK